MEHAAYRYGEGLRDAYSHYEEALARPQHQHRGTPVGVYSALGSELPQWMTGHMIDGKNGPELIWLLGHSYRLDGVHEALVNLESELSDVLIDPATGTWRR